jgi:hypothetical protein
MRLTKLDHAALNLRCQAEFGRFEECLGILAKYKSDKIGEENLRDAACGALEKGHYDLAVMLIDKCKALKSLGKKNEQTTIHPNNLAS